LNENYYLTFVTSFSLFPLGLLIERENDFPVILHAARRSASPGRWTLLVYEKGKAAPYFNFAAIF
jgi:hypothetical protein